MNDAASGAVNETFKKHFYVAFPFINFTNFISFSLEYSQLNQIYAL